MIIQMSSIWSTYDHLSIYLSMNWGHILFLLLFKVHQKMQYRTEDKILFEVTFSSILIASFFDLSGTFFWFLAFLSPTIYCKYFCLAMLKEHVLLDRVGQERRLRFRSIKMRSDLKKKPFDKSGMGFMLPLGWKSIKILIYLT